MGLRKNNCTNSTSQSINDSQTPEINEAFHQKAQMDNARNGNSYCGEEIAILGIDY
jgi:hypothetical protein